MFFRKPGAKKPWAIERGATHYTHRFQIIDDTNYQKPEKRMLRIGVDVLPAIPKDTTDRNHTSPLVFTGNKFELRMLGSSQSIAQHNIALNTIMAEKLGRFADVLESAECPGGGSV